MIFYKITGCNRSYSILQQSSFRRQSILSDPQTDILVGCRQIPTDFIRIDLPITIQIPVTLETCIFCRHYTFIRIRLIIDIFIPFRISCFSQPLECIISSVCFRFRFINPFIISINPFAIIPMSFDIITSLRIHTPMFAFRLNTPCRRKSSIRKLLIVNGFNRTLVDHNV